MTMKIFLPSLILEATYSELAGKTGVVEDVYSLAYQIVLESWKAAVVRISLTESLNLGMASSRVAFSSASYKAVTAAYRMIGSGSTMLV